MVSKVCQIHIGSHAQFASVFLQQLNGFFITVTVWITDSPIVDIPTHFIYKFDGLLNFKFLFLTWQ